MSYWTLSDFTGPVPYNALGFVARIDNGFCCYEWQTVRISYFIGEIVINVTMNAVRNIERDNRQSSIHELEETIEEFVPGRVYSDAVPPPEESEEDTGEAVSNTIIPEDVAETNEETPSDNTIYTNAVPPPEESEEDTGEAISNTIIPEDVAEANEETPSDNTISSAEADHNRSPTPTPKVSRRQNVLERLANFFLKKTKNGRQPATEKPKKLCHKCSCFGGMFGK